MMPGLLAMFAKEGWLILLWGIMLLPIGFANPRPSGLGRKQPVERSSGERPLYPESSRSLEFILNGWK